MVDESKIWPTPVRFPSRHRFSFDPAVPNKQLWAIGMVVAQWGMTEMIMHNHVTDLIGDDIPLRAEYAKQDSFRHQRVFWESLIKTRVCDPVQRDNLITLLQSVKDLKSQRDRIMHQLWGGGMEGSSWSSCGNSSSDAALLKVQEGPPSWRLSFIGVRRIAKQISELNAALSVATDPLPSDRQAIEA